MALPQWTVLTGYNLGSYNEREPVNLLLPLASTVDVTVSLISGKLPAGLRLEGTTIVGIPLEVPRTTDFQFTLRASTVDGISDRTFRITVEGYDAPQWLTPEGPLNLSPNRSGSYWLDTANSSWGIYDTNGGSNWNSVDITVYEAVPSRTEGYDGDYVFVTDDFYFYKKIDGRWRKITSINIKEYIGLDQSLVVSDTVPNPNLVDFWFNTNILNNGLDLKLKRYNENIPSWITADFTISKTAPIDPNDGDIWLQLYDNSFNFNFKVFQSVENNWTPLKVTSAATPPDLSSNAYFILDSSLVDFQLEALDRDLSSGGFLRYYIADDDGELPPGLTLSIDGRITGIVDPILALDIKQTPGYDSGAFDSAPLDFGVVDDFGFDSYFYDTTIYGYSKPTRVPKKLNRFYNFTVTCADDVSEIKRNFSIYVVGDDFVRADNTIMKSATGLFTADVTYLRNPVWLTPGNLGFKRADNYVTLYLDTFNPNVLQGNVSYLLKDINDDGSVSQLPPGMELDGLTGEIAGRVPYQPAVSTEYKFTVEAFRSEVDIETIDEFVGQIYEDTLAGRTELRIKKVADDFLGTIRDPLLLIDEEVQIDSNVYTISAVDNTHPSYDVLTLDKPLYPLTQYSPLEIASNESPGSSAFLVKYESLYREVDKKFWLDRTLTYSSTESYTVSLIQEYVNLSVSCGSTSSLEFNYDSAGISAIPGELPTAAFKRWMDNKVSSLGVDPVIYRTFVRFKPSTTNIIEILVPLFPATRNRNLIKEVFHADDSTTVDVTYGNTISEGDFIYRVRLNKPLTRSLTSGTQLSVGAAKDTTIRKRVNATQVESVSSTKTFTVTILGEVDSTITWITPEVLPTQVANRPSYLKIEAETTLVDSNLRYDLIRGKLPFGLELKKDGELVGKVNQFGDSTNKGLTTIDNRSTTFDAGSTSFDRTYTFTVLARDRFGYSARTRTFSLTVVDVDDKIYSNIYMQPYPSLEKREVWESFINNYTIFTPEYIYRPSDPNFGVQKSLRTLAFAGIEQKTIDNYIAAISRNHKKKRFKFGEIKTAVAKQPGTNDVIYELVYIEVIDPQEPTTGETALSYKIKTQNKLPVNQVKLEIKDDTTASEAGIDYFVVTPRSGEAARVTAPGGIATVYTRTGDPVLLLTPGQIEIISRFNGTIVIRSTTVAGTGGSNSLRYRPTTPPISVDSNAIKISQSKDVIKYISNISNIRKRIQEIGVNERQFLPLWMRTAQGSDIAEIDYVVAMPLCFCKPGTSELVKENIINNGFDFKQIDYEIDRYIIDSTEGNQNEQFLLFANYRFNV